MDLPLLVCFAFQWLALFVTVAAALLDGWRVRAWLGWVLIVVYIAFIVTTVVTIVYADTGWRLSGLL